MRFKSEEAMLEAWKTDIYKEASTIRETIMRETAVGVHVTSVEEVVKIV